MNKEIQKDLKIILSDLFSQEDHFTIVYGSYAYGIANEESDLDFVTVCSDQKMNRLPKLINSCFELYDKYDLKHDNEVPHENKLLNSYSTLDSAIKGKCFLRDRKRIIVPEIQKTEEFLSSEEVKQRLLLNALTGKAYFLSGNKDLFEDARKRAQENLVGFIFGIENRSLSVPNFVHSMIGNNPDRTGEMYLGYKPKPAIVSYLIKKYSVVLESMGSEGKLRRFNRKFVIRDMDWYENLLENISSV